MALWSPLFSSLCKEAIFASHNGNLAGSEDEKSLTLVADLYYTKGNNLKNPEPQMSMCIRK